MRKQWWSWFSIVAALFLLTSCAAISKWYSQTHYETFELTLDGKKVVVNLPDGLPSMVEAILNFEGCFNLKTCWQRFCVSKELSHDHVDFVFVDSKVIALVWIVEKEVDWSKRYVAWIYIEKKPISAPIDAINELIEKHSPKG